MFRRSGGWARTGPTADPVVAFQASVLSALRSQRTVLWSAFTGWTLLLCGLGAYAVVRERAEVEDEARVLARAFYDADVAHRRWASSQGAGHAPAPAEASPGLPLAGAPEQEGTTPSARRLTVVCPDGIAPGGALLGQLPGGATVRLTSLDPASRATTPDAWERKALQELGPGSRGVSWVGVEGGRSVLRFLGPFGSGESCRSCHRDERGAGGRARGALSVTVPLAAYHAVATRRVRGHVLVLAGVWLVGAAGLDAARRLVERRERERQSAAEALRLSEQKFRTVAEFTSDWEVWTAPDGGYIYVSPSCFEISGYRRQEFFDDPGLMSRIVHPNDRAIWEAHLGCEQGPADGTDEPRRLELRLVARDGGSRWIEHVCRVIRDEAGQFQGRRVSNRDVTTRKESEALYRAMFEENKAVKLLIDPADGRIIEANQAACDYYGYPREALTAKRIFDINALPEGEVRGRMDLALSGSVPGFLFQHRLASGELRDVEVHAGPVSVAGRSLLFSIVQDVTSRQQALEALRRSEERFRTIAEALHDVIVLTDEIGTLTYLSPAFERVFGWPPEEWLGRGIAELAAPEEAAAASDAFERVLSTGFVAGAVLRLRRRDGSTFLGEASGTRSLHGSRVETISVVRDVTERVEMEARLAQSQKIESIGRLAGGVAHDFNNMLQVILANTSLALRDAPAPGRMNELLQAIESATRRSAGLTAQLLAFARKQTIRPRTVDLNDIVSSVLRMLRRLIREDVRLLWVPGSGLWPVRVDPVQVEQVVTNLAVNARDAIDGPGEIVIETRNAVVHAGSSRAGAAEAGDYVLLRVFDSGRGMGADVQAHLFEPFFTTKEAGSGTGLGLATVFGIVKQNGGVIRVDSAPGRGTAMEVLLPRATGEAATGAEETSAPLPRGSETILLVEDEEEILKVTRRLLEQQGYTVLAADRPGHALDLASGHDGPIHLLVTDVVMPGMDGTKLRQALAARAPRMRCLYISGYASAVRGDPEGAGATTGFLQKPFDAASLIRKVRNLLDA